MLEALEAILNEEPDCTVPPLPLTSLPMNTKTITPSIMRRGGS